MELHILTKTVKTQFPVDDSFLSSTTQANPVSDSHISQDY